MRNHSWMARKEDSTGSGSSPRDYLQSHDSVVVGDKNGNNVR